MYKCNHSSSAATLCMASTFSFLKALCNRITKYRSLNCRIVNGSFSELIIKHFDWLNYYFFITLDIKIPKKTTKS